MPPEVDDRLGEVLKESYRFEERIGRGAAGAIYRGVQLAVDRPVAIKVLRHEDLDAAALHQVSERFRREAVATSRLKHPNTVSLLDFGTTKDGLPFLVLELLEGRPLSQVLRRTGALDPGRAARIGLQIAKSLSEAHGHGIVHRDLKPDNVFLCPFEGDPDFVKVLDFGIARMTGGEEAMRQLTADNAAVGTPVYMSPEQADAQPVGQPSDIYSLGVVLYELVSGRPPFMADTFFEIAVQHLRREAPPVELEDTAPGITAVWNELLARLLSKQPEARPTATELITALEYLVSLHAGRAEAPPPPRAAPEPAPGERPRGQTTWLGTATHRLRSDRRLAATVAGVGAALALAVVLLVAGGSPPPSELPEGVTRADVLRRLAPGGAIDLVDVSVAAWDALPSGDLRIESRPQGARLMWDDFVDICVTPCTMIRPPSLEPLILRLYLDGFLHARIELEPDDSRDHRKVLLTKRGTKGR